MSTYYFVPSRNVFGEGSVEETGHLIKSIGGTKAMIVTDAFLAANPMTARIQKILADAGVQSAVFGKAEPNPKDTNVVEGEQFYHENECDCILSLGGGSSHDCAKGIGLVATNGGKISDYEGVDQAHEALPPLVAVNTTAGTASEITRFCIITDTTRKVKMCIVDWRVTPAIAINDPELMVGMPASLTAATGMDALTHAVEAYVSTAANPLTDAAAIKAIDKIVHYLPQAVANGDYMKARSEMAYAQYLAGVAFNNASLGYVHAMAHQLGGFYNLPHGVCNAILLPYVQEFNLIGNLERFAVIAETMDINVKGMSLRGRRSLRLCPEDLWQVPGHPPEPALPGRQAGGLRDHGRARHAGRLRRHQPQKGHQRADHCDLPKSIRRGLILRSFTLLTNILSFLSFTLKRARTRRMPCPCSQFSQKPRPTLSGPKPLPKTKINPVGAADPCGPLPRPQGLQVPQGLYPWSINSERLLVTSCLFCAEILATPLQSGLWNLWELVFST